MNQSTLALAVAGTLALATAAQAETTLYGSARVGVAHTDQELNPQGMDVPNGSFWGMRDEGGSRLGVRGSEDLGGGLSAIYQYELGVNINGSVSGNPLNQRLSWVGLKGGFGSFTVGRQWTPYNNAVALDGVWSSDDTTTTYYQLGAPWRVGNMLIYTSPDWSGFSVAGGMVLDGQGNDDPDPSKRTKNGVDMYDLTASYKNGPLKLGLGYRKFEGRVVGENGQDFYGEGDSLWGAAASYEFAGAFNLIGSYQQADLESRSGAQHDAEPRAYSVTGEYEFGRNKVRAGVGRMDLDTLASSFGRDDENQDIWKVGFEHRLSKRTRTWVEYGDYDFSSFSNNANNFRQGFEYNNVSIGMRHDF